MLPGAGVRIEISRLYASTKRTTQHACLIRLRHSPNCNHVTGLAEPNVENLLDNDEYCRNSRIILIK